MNLPHFCCKWNYRKGRKEKDFQTEIFWHLRRMWYICWHPSDIWLSLKFLDWYILSPKWESLWIEFKKIEKDSFNIKQFEDSQVILLKQMDKRNSKLAKVYIYSVKNNDYKVFTFSELWNMKNSKWWIKIFNKK